MASAVGSGITSAAVLPSMNRTVDAEIFFGRAVDQQIAQVGNVLDDDRRRHVLDDRVEERARALKLALGTIALRHVFMRRHPAAAFHRLVHDRDGAAVLAIRCSG